MAFSGVSEMPLVESSLEFVNYQDFGSHVI